MATQVEASKTTPFTLPRACANPGGTLRGDIRPTSTAPSRLISGCLNPWTL